MSEKNHTFSSEEILILQGIESRSREAEQEHNSTLSLLDFALRVKADALNQFGDDLERNRKFLDACDRVVELIEQNPNKTISDLLGEGRR